MRFILVVFVAVIALIMSGFLTLFGILDWIPGMDFWILNLITLILSSVLVWSRFRSMSQFKFFVLKTYLRLNGFFSKMDTRLSYSDEEKQVTELQEKGIRLWKLCLKDPDTSLTSSISNQIRQIEKDNVVIILNPINAVDYLMTIMDVDPTKSCLYEIRIGQKLSESVISSFDGENERRMKLGEEERRKSIFMDLDKLLLQEEEAVRKNKTRR